MNCNINSASIAIQFNPLLHVEGKSEVLRYLYEYCTVLCGVVTFLIW